MKEYAMDLEQRLREDTLERGIVMKQYRCQFHVSEDVALVVQASDEAHARVLGELAARAWRDSQRPRADLTVGDPTVLEPGLDGDANWETLAVAYTVFDR